VIVAVPTRHHFAVASTFLRAEQHFGVEKPGELRGPRAPPQTTGLPTWEGCADGLLETYAEILGGGTDS
jgi:hypothetical protein